MALIPSDSVSRIAESKRLLEKRLLDTIRIEVSKFYNETGGIPVSSIYVDLIEVSTFGQEDFIVGSVDCQIKIPGLK